MGCLYGVGRGVKWAREMRNDTIENVITPHMKLYRRDYCDINLIYVKQ